MSLYEYIRLTKPLHQCPIKTHSQWPYGSTKLLDAYQSIKHSYFLE